MKAMFHERMAGKLGRVGFFIDLALTKVPNATSMVTTLIYELQVAPYLTSNWSLSSYLKFFFMILGFLIMNVYFQDT
jgi:hypothetical protein